MLSTDSEMKKKIISLYVIGILFVHQPNSLSTNFIIRNMLTDFSTKCTKQKVIVRVWI